MNTITTSLPVSLDDMKLLITTPNSSVVIEYAKSQLKGRAALIYTTNANLPNPSFDMAGVDREDVYDLVDNYITQKSVVRINNLIYSVATLLFAAKGLTVPHEDRVEFDKVSLVQPEEIGAYMSNAQRSQNLNRLIEVLDNIVLFALTCSQGFRETCGDLSSMATIVNDVDYTGCTFVNLLEEEWFTTTYFSSVSLANPKYFSQQYDEYLFNGRNLFSYVTATFLIPALDMLLSQPEQVPNLLSAANESFEAAEITS